MNEKGQARSAGFDGRRFYYAQGAMRVTLLDTEDAAHPMSESLKACLLRQLRGLGADTMAAGASMMLIFLAGEIIRYPASEPLLLLELGGQRLPQSVASLLRTHFWAAGADAAYRQAAHASRLCLVGREGDNRANPPEIELLSQTAALPAPQRGYASVLFVDDVAERDASVLRRAIAAAAPQALLLVLTGRQSVLDAAGEMSVQGSIYPVTDHFVLYVGRKRGARLPGLPPLELPLIRHTMVFLPYKASMWDCLESIYLAAAADTETAVYVIPIPFAEKNPDGSIRDWQYEGKQFPGIVPIVDWREINLMRLQPEAIFIHNPFDDANTVTTVDARYYTPRLKACTRKLVFVPYFVTGGNVYPELVVAPAYHTADHVICENEGDKAKFEQFYPWGPPPADKFLPLGSPKFDKVRTDTRAAYPLPPAWAQLLSGRHSVLYNVTLVAVLHNSAHFLPKLRWVLEKFREQKEVVLWWRPHPLLLSTLTSMRPGLVEEYLSLVQSYREAGWGIYDDTPDLHRAIAWTDGYYGDYGSMVWLMQAAGKPVLTQNYGLHG